MVQNGDGRWWFRSSVVQTDDGLERRWSVVDGCSYQLWFRTTVVIGGSDRWWSVMVGDGRWLVVDNDWRWFRTAVVDGRRWSVMVDDGRWSVVDGGSSDRQWSVVVQIDDQNGGGQWWSVVVLIGSGRRWLT
ncbi:hypothetical protein L6452_32279 [Arctium lappa]|uniref:Uncharacterized protein n=1 Tax=Arctium lappa TaxID=4217 RepID=A0ACB8Z524_ARCLA|nr:hypothetical protein L6452_32279 [Arctium lappa]